MLEIIVRDHLHPYPPRVSEFTKTFWDGLAQGRFLTTRGARSKRLTFPPKQLSPHDWNESVEWVELSGKGKLSATVSFSFGDADVRTTRSLVSPRQYK